MAMYLAELVFLVELAMLATGLVLFYKAGKEASGVLKTAAILLIIGSIGTATCTTYFSLKYYNQGAFDTAFLGDRWASVDDDGPLHHYHPAEWNGEIIKE